MKDPRPDCPYVSLHTPCPDGYVAWAEWAEEMSQTHVQILCQGCQRYTIWVPKRDRGIVVAA